MKKKTLSAMMALSMAMTGVSALPVSAEEQVDGEGYEVNFVYVVSGTLADQDAVNNALSNLASEEINMNVNVTALTYVDALNQIPLMLASGSGIDVFLNWSNNMSSFIDSGYIEDLSEHTDQLGTVLEWMSEDDLACCSINDLIWGVPVNKERAQCEAVFMRKDILDELQINPDDIKTYDDITNVFAQVKEAYPDMTILGGASYESIADMGDVAFAGDSLGDELGILENYGAEPVVVNQFETDAWREAVDVTRAWYEAGYISEDMPTSQDSGETMIASGNTFAFANNWKPDSAVEKFSTTGYELAPILITDPMTATQMVGGAAYCVSSTAGDVDKSVMFLDWLVGSAEANDLLNWGIEGTHWVEDENGNATYPEGVSGENCGYHNGWGFIMPNQFAGHLWEGNDPDLYQQYADYQANAHKSAAYGFTFDATDVTNEVIACQAVLDQYIASICTGSVDPEPMIKEMNEALYDAGLQEIMDAKQEQLDAWLAEQ